MLSIRSPELTHLITRSLYPLINNSSLPLLLSSWKSLFYFLLLGVFLFKKKIPHPHKREVIQHLSFSIWLISLSIMPLKTIHVVLFFFFFCSWIIVYHIYHTFTIHLSVDKHRGCFHVLAIVRNAAADMGLQMPFWDSDFLYFRCVPRSGIAASYGVSIFNLSWGNSILFSIVAAPTYVPTNSAWGSPFLHVLSTCTLSSCWW